MPPAAAAPSTPPSWRLVNRQQLAQLLGVHPDTVTDFAAQGMPVVVKGGRGAESEYDAVECSAWHRRHLGKNAKDAAQTRAFAAQADLNELKLKQQLGDVLPREIVELEGQQFAKAIASKVRSIPRRLTNAGAIGRADEAAVLALLRDILHDISTWNTYEQLQRAIGKKGRHAAA